MWNIYILWKYFPKEVVKNIDWQNIISHKRIEENKKKKRKKKKHFQYSEIVCPQKIILFDKEKNYWFFFLILILSDTYIERESNLMIRVSFLYLLIVCEEN